MKSILDVNNIVYGGHYGSPEFRISGFPVGGIRKIMGILNANLSHSEFALCFDGGKSAKRELLPSYKARRVPNYSVIAQLELLREILLDCDISFYQEPSYEADDMICSLVKFLAVMRDTDRVTVYSDDRDLACCVCSNVDIHNVTSNGICITRENYEQRVVAHEDIPYNTILLHKMVYGDKSDNYAGLNVPGLRFDVLAQALICEIQPLIDAGTLPEIAYMDVDIINIVIDNLSEQFSEEMKDKIKAQARIVFPRMIDVTKSGIPSLIQDAQQTGDPLYRVIQRHTHFFGLDGFNRQKFNFYCNMLRLNRCHTNRYSTSFENDEAEFKRKLSLRAKDLSNGVYATEKRYKIEAAPVTSSVIQNMELPL